MLFLDNFVGVNGTHLAAHTPDVGGPWIDDIPGWQLASDYAVPTVNPANSHVEMAFPRSFQVIMVGDYNGAAPGSHLIFDVGDDAGNNVVTLDFEPQDNYMQLVIATVQIADCDQFPGLVSFPAASGLWVARLLVGPDQMKITMNGTTVYLGPRGFLKSFAPSRIAIRNNSPVGVPPVRCKFLQVVP